jgi:hypothetical protein
MRSVQGRSKANANVTKTPFFQKKSNGYFFGHTGNPFFDSSPVQAKLAVNEPNDKYEQEADAMADKVVQRLATQESFTKKDTAVQTKKIATTISPVVQTKCAGCEQEEKLERKEEEDLVQESPLDLQRKPIFESNAEPPDDENNIQLKCATCEKEEKKLQTKNESNSSSSTLSSVETVLNGSKGHGDPIPDTTRADMESFFGADFSDVRIHNDSSAVQMNKSLNAQAFTHGNDIYFNAGKYDTNSRGGKHLLAHELTHTLQQNNASLSNSLQLSPESDLISANTSWGNLNESALGQNLLVRARRGEYAFVGRVLDELGSTDRDDVAFEMLHAAREDAIIETFARTPEGRGMLDRLFDELTAGSVAEEEQTQADRIINIKSRILNTPAQFDQAINSAAIKIFPFRLPGVTVFDDAPISASRGENNRIIVNIPVRVLGTGMFREETRTLNGQFHFTLPENEIVGIRMYDLGGQVIYRPAMFLLQLSNQTDTRILQTIVEVAGVGLTLGSGALAATATTRLGQMVLWADRIAFGVSTISMVIREHRGWIIQRFGQNGREFLRYVDMVNSVVAIYGGARALIGMGQLLTNLARATINWRRAVTAANAELEASEREVVNTMSQHADNTLNDVEQLQQARVGSTPAPENPPIVTENPPIGAEHPPGFDARGRLPRGGNRPVLNQGNAPTCGPVSCGMVIDTAGNQYELANLVREAGPNGTPLETMLSILRRHRINANMELELTVAELASATRNGNPAIAIIRTSSPRHPLHAIVIDGITTRNGARVVAIRNPWGQRYFELLEVFERTFTGQGITVNYSY